MQLRQPLNLRQPLQMTAHKLRPTLYLPFAGASSLAISPYTITYTGSNGTYFNSSGTLTAATTNVARLDYDPSTLIARGLLIEEARTNLIIRSEEFDSDSWTKTDTTITANSIASPDRATTADLVTEGSAGTASIVQVVTATANANYATSRFFKRGNTDWVEMHLADGVSTVRQWFNLNTRAIGSNTVSGTGAFVSASVQQLPNGWMRATLVGSLGGGTTAISATTISASADGATTRVANSTRYEWGAQFENNVSFVTSYIPTAAATVTRSADLASMTGSNFSSWYNQSQGTFVAQYMLGSTIPSGNFPTVVTAYDGTTGNEIGIYLFNSSGSNRSSFVSKVGGVTQADVGAASSTFNGTVGVAHKLVGAYQQDNFGASFDGSAVLTDSSGTLPAVDRLGIGNVIGGQLLNGWIQSIAYYPQRLPNTQLQGLSL